MEIAHIFLLNLEGNWMSMRINSTTEISKLVSAIIDNISFEIISHFFREKKEYLRHKFRILISSDWRVFTLFECEFRSFLKKGNF